MEAIGDEGNQAEAEKERNRVRRMLQALGMEAPLPEPKKEVTVPSTLAEPAAQRTPSRPALGISTA